MMNIRQMIAALPYAARVYGNTDTEREIVGLAYDSRKVTAGYAFFAIPGVKTDGHSYIPQVVEQGAAVVFVEREVVLPSQVTGIIVPNSRHALAYISAEWFGRPDKTMRILAVTGTNGKTTTTTLIKYLLDCAGHKSGLIGTVGGMAGDERLPEHLSASTTPESPEMFAQFAMMVERGCDYAVIEASSHSLDQGRTVSCAFAGAGFTNLTQDHLDYHLTMDNYCEAKIKLFSGLDDSAYSVINCDDPYAGRFIAAAPGAVWTYGESEQATVRMVDYSESIHGTVFHVVYGGQTYAVDMPLIGRFNVYNAMAAMCFALAEGQAIGDIIERLRTAPQIPGRFELINEGQDFAVVVDYAHTPDGYINVLTAARQLDPQRILIVFGCGGDRDNLKRPIMGRIAGEMCDVCFLTSDNPRTEDPWRVIRMVEEGLRETAGEYHVEIDRRLAMKMAFAAAHAGDMVIMVGRGHETYQTVGTKKVPFDDRVVARELLQEQLSAVNK